MKLIQTIFFSFINLISKPAKDYKEINTHKKVGIYKEISDIHLKTRNIALVLESSIIDLESDYKECNEQIRTALIKDNEADARLWLQKQSLIRNTLHKYNTIFFTIKNELAAIENDVNLVSNAYSKLHKNQINANRQIA